MDLGSIFLILALLLLVVMFVTRPFFTPRVAQEHALATAEDHEVSHLLAERDRVLNALQELEFDFALGKIPEEDYPTQRAILLQHGADVLRKLDAFQVDEEHEEAEARIEAVIAARRADAARGQVASQAQKQRARQVNQVASPDDQLEALLANRRRARSGTAGGFCSQCGGPVQKTDRFCPKCGNTVG